MKRWNISWFELGKYEKSDIVYFDVYGDGARYRVLWTNSAINFNKQVNGNWQTLKSW